MQPILGKRSVPDSPLSTCDIPPPKKQQKNKPDKFINYIKTFETSLRESNHPSRIFWNLQEEIPYSVGKIEGGKVLCFTYNSMYDASTSLIQKIATIQFPAIEPCGFGLNRFKNAFFRILGFSTFQKKEMFIPSIETIELIWEAIQQDICDLSKSGILWERESEEQINSLGLRVLSLELLPPSELSGLAGIEEAFSFKGRVLQDLNIIKAEKEADDETFYTVVSSLQSFVSTGFEFTHDVRFHLCYFISFLVNNMLKDLSTEEEFCKKMLLVKALKSAISDAQTKSDTRLTTPEKALLERNLPLLKAMTGLIADSTSNNLSKPDEFIFDGKFRILDELNWLKIFQTLNESPLFSNYLKSRFPSILESDLEEIDSIFNKL